MNKWLIMIIFLGIMTFTVGCQTNKSTIETANCEAPSIRSGDTCCLDENANNICDSNEEKTMEATTALTTTLTAIPPQEHDAASQTSATNVKTNETYNDMIADVNEFIYSFNVQQYPIISGVYYNRDMNVRRSKAMDPFELYYFFDNEFTKSTPAKLYPLWLLYIELYNTRYGIDSVMSDNLKNYSTILRRNDGTYQISLVSDHEVYEESDLYLIGKNIEGRWFFKPPIVFQPVITEACKGEFQDDCYFETSIVSGDKSYCEKIDKKYRMTVGNEKDINLYERCLGRDIRLFLSDLKFWIYDISDSSNGDKDIKNSYADIASTWRFGLHEYMYNNFVIKDTASMPKERFVKVAGVLSKYFVTEGFQDVTGPVFYDSKDITLFDLHKTGKNEWPVKFVFNNTAGRWMISLKSMFPYKDLNRYCEMLSRDQFMEENCKAEMASI